MRKGSGLCRIRFKNGQHHETLTDTAVTVNPLGCTDELRSSACHCLLTASRPTDPPHERLTMFEVRPRVLMLMARTARIAALVGITVILPGLAVAADDGPKDSQQLRQQLQQETMLRGALGRKLSLLQGTAKITADQISMLEKQLELTRQKLSDEQQQVISLQQRTESLDASIARLTQELPLHEAADRLVGAADAADSRLASLHQSESKLQEQLSALRKSSVEYRSSVSEGEQRIAALTAARPELQKQRDQSATEKDTAEKGVAAAQVTEKTSADAVKAMQATLTQTQAQQQQAQQSAERNAASLKSLQESLSTLKAAAALTGVDSVAAIGGLEKAITDFAAVTQQNSQLLSALTARAEQQTKELAKLQEKQKQDAALVATKQQEAKPVIEKFTAAAAALTASVEEETQLTTTIARGKVLQETLNAQLLTLSPSLDKLRAEISIAAADGVQLRREAQQALEPLGRFVSFAREVAPVLATRCVACHNTRSPGGRLNLDSWTALLKGGESGESLTPGHSADSLLLAMVEDGSMPKDAAPLEADQIAVLKRWIDAGAPLDAGLASGGDLFDIMPELSQPLPPQEYRTPIPVTAVAFSPDGAELATSGYHEILIWSTADGSLLRRVNNIAERVYDLEYSGDGKQIAVAAGTPGELGELKLFSAADGKLVRTLVRSRDAIFALNFSPDHTRIACCGADRAITVTEIQTGEVQLRVEDHADWVLDVNWSPDGKRLISGSRDKTSKIFEAANGSPVATFSGHGQPVYTAVFLADSVTAATGGGDQRVRIWKSADSKEIRAIGGFGGDVFRLQREADGQLLSASGDGKIHLHKSADGAVVRQFSGHADWVYTVSSHPDRGLIASGCYDGEVRIWNSADGSAVSTFPAVPTTKTVASADAVSSQE